MSRPRKDNSMEAIERRRFVGERIKQCRMDFGSQEKFAELLGVDVSTLRRYESGSYDLPSEKAEILSNEYGIIPQYWRGLTGFKTMAEWEAYIEQESIEDEALIEYETAIETELERKKNLFHLLGYRYQNIERSLSFFFPEVDYVDDEGNIYKIPPFPHNGPHILTRYTEPDTHYYFSDKDLRQLMETITRTIGFACYEISRK